MIRPAERPLAFVTNDDGVHTQFLHELVLALLKDFEVFVAAPKQEQSWVGRAVSRRNNIEVKSYEGLGCPAYVVDGTPTDCANIGLSHLCPRKPDIVVSGINLGFNYTYPMILSSGTIAGAIEGALWGLPALAVSKALPKENFEKIRENGGRVEGNALESLKAAAEHSRQFAQKVMNLPTGGIQVHNVNFPEITALDTPIVETCPGYVQLGPLFKEKSDEPGVYEFGMNVADISDQDTGSDIFSVRNGKISYSLLDYTKLCVE